MDKNNAIKNIDIDNIVLEAMVKGTRYETYAKLTPIEAMYSVMNDIQRGTTIVKVTPDIQIEVPILSIWDWLVLQRFTLKTMYAKEGHRLKYNQSFSDVCIGMARNADKIRLPEADLQDFLKWAELNHLDSAKLQEDCLESDLFLQELMANDYDDYPWHLVRKIEESHTISYRETEKNRILGNGESVRVYRIQESEMYGWIHMCLPY